MIIGAQIEENLFQIGESIYQVSPMSIQGSFFALCNLFLLHRFEK
jgi:hypothetical protein